MNVSEVMTANAVSCHPEDRDSRAAQLMWEHDCGVLPVVDAGGRTVGMVTDRDLCMAAYTRGRALSDLSVRDSMSHEVFGCGEQDSVEDALEVMRRHRVRRLPVLDPEDHVVGLLSMNDVVRAVEQHGERRERQSVIDAMLGTLASVCEHRGALEAELIPRTKPRAAPSKGKSRVRR